MMSDEPTNEQLIEATRVLAKELKDIPGARVLSIHLNGVSDRLQQQADEIEQLSEALDVIRKQKGE